MQAWKAHEHIDFDFIDCQAQDGLNSEDEAYIKRKFRQRIDLAGTYALLIGEDTRYKHRYVKWEAEVAIEKGCRLIGINLDMGTRMDSSTCPTVMQNVGAVFVPFSAKIVAHALKAFEKQPDSNWYYPNETYTKLGYRLNGTKASKIVASAGERFDMFPRRTSKGQF